jgi:YHS domain-containing protein
MFRLVFYAVLLILLARAMRSLWSGIVEGMTGLPPGRGGVPTRAVQMVRDPVCGTFVLPERAVTLSVGREQIHFCSVNCRDKYRARTA